MFEVGDEIICINPSMNGYHDSKLYHIYRVDFVGRTCFYAYDITAKDYQISTLFDFKDFLSLTEYRKKKLEKICSKLEK